MRDPLGQSRAAAAPPQSLRIGPLDCLPSIVLPNQKAEVVNLLDYMAGTKLVLLVVSDPRLPTTAALLRRFAEEREGLQKHANLFVVASTPPEVNAAFAGETFPFFLLSDQRGDLARLLGATSGQDCMTILVADARMRVVQIERDATSPDRAEAILQKLAASSRATPRKLAGFAPLLHVPRIFEPELCDALIAAHRAEGGLQSRAPRMIDGEFRQVYSEAKVRRDHIVQDREILAAISERFTKRIQPEILRAFTRQVTGVEEFKVVSYDAAAGGRFQAHRDNTMAQFAHRRFAMTVHLNTGDYEGGQLRFPEYGADLYAPPKGDAVIYSSTLLHEVMPVTAGCRYALVAHMFDEESRQWSPTFRR